MKSDVTFITLLGIVALLLLRFGEPQHQQHLIPTQDDLDVWQTPFYLRYNVPVTSDQVPIMPTGSPYTFGLGVPARALSSNRTVNY